MATEFSFDIVSKVDMQEVKNAVSMAQKEIIARYDFKGVTAEIELTTDPEGFTLLAQDEMKLKALVDVLEGKLFKRNISLHALEYKDPEPATKGALRQTVLLKQGIERDVGRKIIQLVKDAKLKVHAQMQDEQVRVTGKAKDDLQKVMALVKAEITDTPIQFTNYR